MATKDEEKYLESQAIETMVVPKSLYINRKYNGQTWLAGVGPRDAKIMFITPVVSEEEAAEIRNVGYGKTVPRDPRITDCGQWQILKDIALRNGLDINNCFVTSIVKFLPKDKAQRNKPKMALINKVLPCLEHEIKEINPDIIVCVGKLVWDVLSGEKARESDIYGLWLYSEKYNCKIYAIPHLSKTLKPEQHERFKLDIKNIVSMFESIKTGSSEKLDMQYEVIHNSEELTNLVAKLELIDATVLSVDCEWGGQIHVDGLLRSLQLAWSPTQAAYIRFRDEDAKYVFDVDYKAAGAILAQWLDNPDVKYIGHHVSADLTWMSYWLGLQWRNKAIFDTEFALQCCDEAIDLGLDVLALRYTNFGKYDWDLIQYRKKHTERKGTGYELVSDEVLIPYAVKDVLTVYRAWGPIKKWMEQQNLTRYYDEILNPFVTDVFTFFCLKGVPVDRQKVDAMREFYHWAKEELSKELVSDVTKEASELLYSKLRESLPEDKAETLIAQIDTLTRNSESYKVPDILKQELGIKLWTAIQPTVDHWLAAPSFNHQSVAQLQRWLFQVKKYTPVKSTANKDAGMPSVSWDKVLTYPPDKQATFTPAADKGTLEILAARNDDALLRQMLEVKSACNICRSFLRPAEKDDEGNVVTEQGLHYWIASDDAIHLNHSCTETGRSRSWNPNTLNWPSYIHARLGAGITRIIAKRKEQGQLPKQYDHYSKLKAKQLPTIRSIVMARPGWCIVESDYQTAEMRGLAFISGDKDLTRLILEPDQCFAKVKPECIPAGIDAEDCVVRLKFPSYITHPEDKDKYIMTYASGGEIKATFTEDQLLRDAEGNIVSPRFDMHWGVAEMGYGKCREVMDKKKDRGSAKVINFCLTADTLVLTNNGEKYIKDVQDSDLLWDGESWVSHKGVIKYDNKHTISYAGLTATPDHLVWTTRGVVTLLEAAVRGSTLIKTAEAGVPVSYTGASYMHKSYKSKQRQQAKAVCASRMPSLWKGILEEFRKLGTWERNTMSLSCAQEIQNDSYCCFQTIRAALQLHDTKMLRWLAQTISRLQRKGYQSMLLVEGGVYNLGIQRISRGGLCGERVRSHRQQWRLLENESSTCDEFDKPFKYTESLSLASASGEVYGATPERSIQTSHIEEFNAARIVRQGDFRAFIALLQRLQAEDKILQSCIQNDVYDIIDAGKHHRFTANGYLVSNSSSYGGQPASLARQVEIQTGVRIPVEEAATLLEAVGRRQPRAEEFFKEMETIPKTTGIIRAASGRIRHCHTFKNDVEGLSVRTREGLLSALGRECRNFQLQESVGASAARACYWMVAFAEDNREKYGLQGYPCVCLYDSIVIHCPEEERSLWAKALELYMFKKNGWVYGEDNRILRYAIDTELNAGWSTAPDAARKALLADPQYKPLPARLQPLMDSVLAEINKYDIIPEDSVYNHWDFK